MDFTERLKEYRDREIEVLKKLDLASVNAVMNVLEEARNAGKHIFIFGNGGSAATASHYAGDFNKGVNMGLLGLDNHASVERLYSMSDKDRFHLYNFESLNDNIPTMLAMANDISYDEVFRYPLSVKMKDGDIVIGISGSGNSTNVINAIDYAKKHGGRTIAIVGYNGGKLKEITDYTIHVDINDMQISEDVHMILDHMMMWC